MRLLLFDIDGTLLSAHGAGRRALERAVEAHYGLSGSLEEVPLDGKTDPLIVREALRAGGRSFDGLDRRFLELYLGLLRDELDRCREFTVLEGVLDLMQRLGSNRGLLLGLATGNVEGGAWLKVRRAGLEGFFRYGGFGSDAEDRTEVIRAAVERGSRLAGEPVRDFVVIGDTPRDIEHGRRAGARVVAVATGSYPLQDLQGYRPDLGVSSLVPAAELVDFLEA